MNIEPNNILNAIRTMGASWEDFITVSISGGKKAELTAEDIKFTALVAFMMATELQRRLDAYETKSADEWMSVPEAAAEASCSRRTLFRAIGKGELISKKVNGHRVVQRKSLDQFAQYRSLFNE